MVGLAGQPLWTAPRPRSRPIGPGRAGRMDAGESRRLWLLPVRAVVPAGGPAGLAAGGPALPGLPAGAVVSVAWRLEGAGRVVGALLPPGHADGGWLGARVLAGEGVWPATMWPAGREISLGASVVELAGEPVRLVVHAPGRDVVGTVDQPGRPCLAGRPRAGAGNRGRASAIVGRVADLRRDSRQVRIRAADRVWWLRASGIFGVRVSRGGEQVYATCGMVGQFSSRADELDISVVLLTLASIPSSAYAPILGF